MTHPRFQQTTTRPRFLMKWTGKPPSDAVLVALEDGELTLAYNSRSASEMKIVVSIGETRELAKMLAREIGI